MKITQEQLNNLIREQAGRSTIHLKQLLEQHNFTADISELYFDAKLLKNSRFTGERILDFSGLNLNSTRFVDLKANEVSFAGSDLTNGSIKFEQVDKINFAHSNLTRCFINEIESREVIFTGANLNETMIFTPKNELVNLDEHQVREIIYLDIGPDARFNQVEFINKYRDVLDDYLCFGIGSAEYARHYLKAKDRGEAEFESSFLAKLNRKMEKRSDNFLQRIKQYHKNLQTTDLMINIMLEGVENNQFLRTIECRVGELEASNPGLTQDMAKADLLSCYVNFSDDEKNAHVFTVVKLKNADEVVGYKIFDSNLGEIRCDLSSKEENARKCNQQVNLLFKHYQQDMTHRARVFTVTNLNEIIYALELVKPKATYRKQDKYLDGVVPNQDPDKPKSFVESIFSSVSSIAGGRRK